MKFAVIFAIAGFTAAAGLAAAGDAGTYSGPGGAIPDEGALTSSIVVSGDTNFPITSVVVSLQGLTHTWIGDLTATVTSPSGSVHTLFSRVGLRNSIGSGDTSDLNGTYSFADGGADLWATAAGVFSGDVIAPGIYHTSAGNSAAIAAL